MKINGYLKADILRSISCKRFFISVCGIAVLMWIASIETIQWRNNVILSSYFVMMSTPFLVAYMIAAIPFSGCLCEDLEYRYCYLQLARGNLKKYTFYKSIVVFLSACITMAAGVILFIFILHLFVPWFSKEDDIYRTLLTEGCFRSLLKNNNFFLYYLCVGFQKGLFAGLLALISTLASMVYTNKLFTLTVPGVAWYFFNTIELKLNLPEWFVLNHIFSVDHNFMKNEVYSIFYMLVITLLIFFLLEKLIEISLNRRLKG